LKFSPTAWRIVEDVIDSLDADTRCRLDCTALLRRLLAAKTLTIRTVATDGQWGEVDNPQDVALYRSMIRRGELVLEAGS